MHAVTHVDPRAYAAVLRRLLAEMDENPARPVPETKDLVGGESISREACMKVSAMGSEIRRLRKAKRMTLVAMAAGLKVSIPFLSDIERGRRPCPAGRVKEIAAILGVDVGALLDAGGYCRTCHGSGRV